MNDPAGSQRCHQPVGPMESRGLQSIAAADRLEGSAALRGEPVPEWGRQMLRLRRKFGLSILGGCCGTGLDHLEELVRRLDR